MGSMEEMENSFFGKYGVVELLPIIFSSEIKLT
jgi:hypothetical protein